MPYLNREVILCAFYRVRVSSIWLITIQCLFLRKAFDTSPVLYEVLPVRTGRNFQTYSIRGTQKGLLCLMLVCMFQKPELVKTPPVQYPMPSDVPPPEDLELDADFYRRQADLPGCSTHMKSVYAGFTHVRFPVSTSDLSQK